METTNLLGVIGRKCSRSGCVGVAVATLTFDYSASTAVLGRLAPEPEPGTYDLCVAHAKATSAPKGWELVVLTEVDPTPPPLATDDLLALANAVREIGFAEDAEKPEPVNNRQPDTSTIVELSRRKHLRVIADAGN